MNRSEELVHEAHQESKPMKESRHEHKESNDDPEFEIEPEHHLKKTKSKHERKQREKKEKKEKKGDLFESPGEMKEFKETTQA
jgi:hypothetical protein